MQDILIVLAAYLLGSFSPGYLLVRWRKGIDVRAIGSGTTGAFNVGRVLKTPGFFLTLAGDLLKGVIAIAIAQTFELGAVAQMCALVAVVLGHNFPVHLGFRGGNGLATVTGALLIYDLQLALALAALFCLSLPVLALLKSVFKMPVQYYTPSKVTVLATPLIALALGRAWWLVVGLALLVGIIMWTIRNNMRRLAAINTPSA